MKAPQHRWKAVSRVAPVGLQVHPPERRRRSVIVASPSCCCCCLHSVGGLVGAGMVSGGRSGRSAAGLYWLVLVVLSILAGIVTGIVYNEPLAGFFFLILLMPAVQLGASVVAALVIVFDWTRS